MCMADLPLKIEEDFRTTVFRFAFWHRLKERRLSIALRDNQDGIVADAKPHQGFGHRLRPVDGNSEINNVMAGHRQVLGTAGRMANDPNDSTLRLMLISDLFQSLVIAPLNNGRAVSEFDHGVHA